MYTIKKQFDFCYGHRVWSQELNPELSLMTCNKCRQLHGHQGQIILSFSREFLADGMVMDFNNLNFFKKFIDNNFDHKFVFDLNDPALFSLFPVLKCEIGSKEFKDIFLWNDDLGLFYTIKQSVYENLDPFMKEIYAGLVFVNFVPTSENLCSYFSQVVHSKMHNFLAQNNIKLDGVQFFETPKSQSIYSIQ